MTVATHEKQEKEQRNIYIRQRFSKYYKDNYEPKRRLIAEHINLGYTNFRRFTVNKHEYSHEPLDKIEKFLKEQGY